MKKTTIIIGLNVILITAIVFFGIFFNRFIWNNGQCRHCGGEMIYTDTKIKNSHNDSPTMMKYYFTCENCGEMITLTFNPKDHFAKYLFN